MADAVIVAQTKAVVAAIQAMTGLDPIPFEIERNYAEFDLELQDVEPLRVDVAPVRHTTSDLRTRGDLFYETEVDVCIRRKFAEDDADPDNQLSIEAIDVLAKFTEDVHARLAAEALSDDSTWSDAKLLWCPNKKLLRNNRQFTGLIRLTYEAVKDLP